MNFDKDKKDLMYDESVLDNNLLGEDKDLVGLKRKNKIDYKEDDINKSDIYYDRLTRSLNRYYDEL